MSSLVDHKAIWSAPRLSTNLIAEITAGGNSTCNDGGMVFDQDRNNGGNCASDIRLKRDIAEVGFIPKGLKLYSFRYNWSEETFVGVMAQEVQDLIPDAVSTGEDDFMRVNYDKIGMPMISVDKFRARRCLQ